jgi:hypothetical protein
VKGFLCITICRIDIEIKGHDSRRCSKILLKARVIIKNILEDKNLQNGPTDIETAGYDST